MPHVLFLLASARENGNAEQLARLAAGSLPADAGQKWLKLSDYPLPPFRDLRHSLGTYPAPEGHARVLLDAILAATDIVFVSPVYWYSVPADLKRLLDEWSAWLRVPELNFRAQMQPKRFWTISSSAGPWDEAQPMFNTLRLSARYFGAEVVGELLGNGSKPGDVLKDGKAVAAAQHFFSLT